MSKFVDTILEIWAVCVVICMVGICLMAVRMARNGSAYRISQIFADFFASLFFAPIYVGIFIASKVLDALDYIRTKYEKK